MPSRARPASTTRTAAASGSQRLTGNTFGVEMIVAGKADSVTDVCNPGSERLTAPDSVTPGDDPDHVERDAPSGASATSCTRADREAAPAFPIDAWPPEPGNRSPNIGSTEDPAPGTASGAIDPSAPGDPDDQSNPPLPSAPGSAAASGSAAGPGSEPASGSSGETCWISIGFDPGSDDAPGSVEPSGPEESPVDVSGETVPFPTVVDVVAPPPPPPLLRVVVVVVGPFPPPLPPPPLRVVVVVVEPFPPPFSVVVV